MIQKRIERQGSRASGSIEVRRVADANQIADVASGKGHGNSFKHQFKNAARFGHIAAVFGEAFVPRPGG